MTREEFVAGCDWAWVRAGVAEARAGCETRIAQVDAETRLACRPPRLAEQEDLARLQATVDAAAAFLALLDRRGL
jgi:hypothetical protein